MDMRRVLLQPTDCVSGHELSDNDCFAIDVLI